MIKYMSKRQKKRKRAGQRHSEHQKVTTTKIQPREGYIKQPNPPADKRPPQSSMPKDKSSQSNSNSNGNGNGNGSPRSLMANGYSRGSTKSSSFTSEESNTSGYMEEKLPRPPLGYYHYQNAHTPTLCNFIDAEFSKLPTGKADKLPKKPWPKKLLPKKPLSSSSSETDVFSSCLSITRELKQEHLDLDLDLPSDLWVPGQEEAPTRTSVLCDNHNDSSSSMFSDMEESYFSACDFGPLMIEDKGDSGGTGYPNPLPWTNPMNHTCGDVPEESDEDEPEEGPGLKPIGYEMLLSRRELRKRVTKLVESVKSVSYLWDAPDAKDENPFGPPKTIWSVDRHQLNRTLNLKEPRIHPDSNGIQLPQAALPQRIYPIANPFFYLNGYMFSPAVFNVFTPEYGQPTAFCVQQPANWQPWWRQRLITNGDVWDDANYINYVAQMEPFPANVDPDLLHAAQLYAIYGEHFFESEMGRRFYQYDQRVPQRTIPQWPVYPQVQYQYQYQYQYPWYHFQYPQYYSAALQLAGWQKPVVNFNPIRQAQQQPIRTWKLEAGGGRKASRQGGFGPGLSGLGGSTGPGKAVGTHKKATASIILKLEGSLAAVVTTGKVSGAGGASGANGPSNATGSSEPLASKLDDLSLNVTNFPPLALPKKKSKK
ncbi:uncharacterized protein LOC108094724 isoform X2 [Drosophila ficusphila]|uniref:uncharacterized protein LOC108094724 isoform X2 n=1 Tax=Drosophila ficusphila TaxID=30025 RepID=UPI0007E79DAF|nr:uncharacterized protein LOC108094724 isoform X2 [Drosophila ficusphila]